MAFPNPPDFTAPEPDAAWWIAPSTRSEMHVRACATTGAQVLRDLDAALLRVAGDRRALGDALSRAPMRVTLTRINALQAVLQQLRAAAPNDPNLPPAHVVAGLLRTEWFWRSAIWYAYHYDAERGVPAPWNLTKVSANARYPGLDQPLTAREMTPTVRCETVLRQEIPDPVLRSPAPDVASRGTSRGIWFALGAVAVVAGAVAFTRR